MKKIIYTGVTIIWMVVIFLFSAAPATESAQMSLSAGRMVGRMLVPGYQDWDEKRQKDFAKKIDYPVRKCAHASEYAVLGVLLFLTIHQHIRTAQIAGKRSGACGAARARRRAVRCAVPAGVLYAASDEFHQLFVPGRSGRISDVMIDTVGVTIGVLLIYMVIKMSDSHKEK